MSTIKNRKGVSIPVDFKISNGKIGGTDIDFVLEFDDKFLIVVELKQDKAQMTVGQTLLLERLVDAWRETGRKAVAIHATWQELTDDGFINMRKCRVHSVYTTDGWLQHAYGRRIIDYLNQIGDHWGCRKCRF